MEKYHYQLKNSKEVKPVHPQTEDEATLEEIKEALRKYRVEGTIKEWNILREELKNFFEEKDVAFLDVSGYIHEWLKGK